MQFLHPPCFSFLLTAFCCAPIDVSDTHPVKSVSFHPSGDFVLAGTDHFMIRVYDVNTMQPYVSTQVDDQHLGGITQVRYSADGKV